MPWISQIARASVVVIVALQLLLVNRLTIGPRWLAPAVELALLVPLSIVTAWAQDMVVKATTDHHWHMIARRRRMIRALAVVLTALISLINLSSLAMLVGALLGTGFTDAHDGRTLLVDALDIWAINIIAFALWYWSMDHGGPAARGLSCRTMIDFQFPQLTMDSEEAAGVVAGLRRLPLPFLHQRHRFLADRHAAAHRARQAADDGAIGHFPADHRAGRRARGQHSVLTGKAKKGPAAFAAGPVIRE